MDATVMLSRLERVDLRAVWTSESGGFTPWLAQSDNLTLLADTLGLELELEATEKDVGPFRADILCRDLTDRADWVLIENQLERTDHTHLGQLLTYAAGLDAATIIWIAQRICDEHRAALDWLNSITSEQFNFFGLEIELWRVGDSPPAPKFNVVCRPNDWRENVRTARTRTVDLSAAHALQQEYWDGLSRDLSVRATSIPALIPRPHFAVRMETELPGAQMRLFVNFTERRCGWEAVCRGANGESCYRSFLAKKETLKRIPHSEVSESTNRRGDMKMVVRCKQWDPNDRATWPQQYGWFADSLSTFFSSILPQNHDGSSLELLRRHERVASS